MQISKFHFISNYQSKRSHFDQVKNAVDGGVKWVQYRPKESNSGLIINEGKRIAAFCKSKGVSLIINDQVDLALELDADGVHLGKEDMSPLKARELLDKGKIIGGTANTLFDCIELINQGVDYIGLGPFRFTKTKKNLSPVLGIKGYKEIAKALQTANKSTPIIAIGGISEPDIRNVLDTGVHGLAISSLVSEAVSISQKARVINKIIYQNLQTL